MALTGSLSLSYVVLGLSLVSKALGSDVISYFKSLQYLLLLKQVSSIVLKMWGA